MRRISITERPNLISIADEHDLEYIAGKGVNGWDESFYYQFSLHQIEKDIEGPAEEIEDLCYQVVDRAVKNEAVLRRLGIDEIFWDFIAESWQKGEKNIYGRMDFSYNGKGPVKLLEYNADTPTALYETAVFQWEWLEHARKLKLISEDCDQFNDLHESIVNAFLQLNIKMLSHFACNQDIEDDKGTLDYLEECAREAGLETCFLPMEDIGIDSQGRFTDLDERVITTLVKLYPWEWIMAEDFGRHVPSSGVRFIEPPWKSILSNKGLMPLLWGMFEGHPNLLPAYFEDDPAAAVFADLGSYVRKPLLSRQGANIEIVHEGKRIYQTDGPYGNEAHIVQGFQPLPDLDGGYPLLGCWLVAGKAVGLCIREDRTLVTGKDARFIPHVILD
jgi:glutathionylspermidine synthase